MKFTIPILALAIVFEASAAPHLSISTESHSSHSHKSMTFSKGFPTDFPEPFKHTGTNSFTGKPPTMTGSSFPIHTGRIDHDHGAGFQHHDGKHTGTKSMPSFTKSFTKRDLKSTGPPPSFTGSFKPTGPHPSGSFSTGSFKPTRTPPAGNPKDGHPPSGSPSGPKPTGSPPPHTASRSIPTGSTLTTSKVKRDQFTKPSTTGPSPTGNPTGPPPNVPKESLSGPPSMNGTFKPSGTPPSMTDKPKDNQPSSGIPSGSEATGVPPFEKPN